MSKQNLIKKYLNNGFSLSEATADIDLATELLFGLTPKDIALGKTPDNNELCQLDSVITMRVETRKPLCQILGLAYFMGEKFEVSEDTLIPRPETELLVKKSVEIIKQNNFKQVLDIGTGTGCIACMVAKNTNAQVLGVDIVNGALKIALNNAMHLDLMNKALFRKSDIFSKIRSEEKFDIIVSNPPYIPLKDKPELQIEVKDFEPSIALFTDDEDGIEFYKKITVQAHNFLNKGGYIAFEIGINQAKTVSKLLHNNGFTDIEILKDVSGIERVIVAKSR